MNQPSVVITLDNTSSLLYAERYIKSSHAEQLMSRCLTDIPWEQSQISIFGKTVAIPRLNAWYGDHPYTYSGTTFPARPLTSPLHQLKAQIEKEFGIQLNSVLANLYRNGSDSVGWHSDNEKILGDYPQIVSVSLGESRRFLIRNKYNKTLKTEIELGHGSLLIMRGNWQRDWEHCVPKTTKPRGQRVNLTFRLCALKDINQEIQIRGYKPGNTN